MTIRAARSMCTRLLGQQSTGSTAIFDIAPLSRSQERPQRSFGMQDPP